MAKEKVKIFRRNWRVLRRRWYGGYVETYLSKDLIDDMIQSGFYED